MPSYVVKKKAVVIADEFCASLLALTVATWLWLFASTYAVGVFGAILISSAVVGLWIFVVWLLGWKVIVEQEIMEAYKFFALKKRI